MRVLVTGSAGFVGRHLLEALRERGHDVFETGPHRSGRRPRRRRHRFARRCKARSSSRVPTPSRTWPPKRSCRPRSKDPAATLRINAGGTLNVLEAARRLAAGGVRTRVLVVSSADVYGAQPPEAYPLRETTAPRPANPYAASKVAAEALASAFVQSFGVDAVVTRAFNHIGTGQDERFAVPAFALQLARIAAGAEPVVRVGNLSATRDVLDVRDVCDAYVQSLEGGGRAGEIQRLQRYGHADAARSCGG